MIESRQTSRKIAGALLFAGATQFILGMTVAEAAYPGYSVSENFISDLGIGPTAALFNSSVFLYGVMVVASAYFIWRVFSHPGIALLLGLAGAGTIGVGVFPENFGIVHTLVALIAFLFGGLSPIATCRLEKAPLSYLSIAMGVISLAALVLLGAGLSLSPGRFFGLGQGGLERMIAYPILLWAIGFSGYLMSSSQITREN